MLEDGGHWLKLMRTATLPTDANICLHISGKELICTVTKDVNKEVELKVTCRFSDNCHEQESDNSTPAENELLISPEAIKVETDSKQELEIVPTDCTSPQSMYDTVVSNGECGCNDTVTTSSSLHSGEVSEERSVKSEIIESDIDMDDFQERSARSHDAQRSPSSDLMPVIGSKNEENHSKTRHHAESESKENIASPPSEHGTEAHSVERQRRHRQDSSKSSSALTNPKSFCEACKIQFMSVNTYQVHKRIYCKSRHDGDESIPTTDIASSSMLNAFKPSGDTVILRGGLNGSISSSIIQPQAIYAAISTNPLILLPCTLVPGQGLIPQNNVIPTGPSGIILQNGMLCATTVDKSVAKPSENYYPVRKTSHPVMNTVDEHKDTTLLSGPKIATLKRKISEGGVLNLKKSCITQEFCDNTSEKLLAEANDTVVEQDSPLDLSVKVKKEILNCNENETLFRRRCSVISSVHPSSPIHHVSVAGSPPSHLISTSAHGVPSPTNSYSNETSQPSTQVPATVHQVPSLSTERLSPLPPVLQSAVIDKPFSAPGILPPKLIKQGNNICDECHIVFIKYDNLVTHKKFYCAYRRRQLSAIAAAAAESSANEENLSDEDSNHSDGNEHASNVSTDESKAGIRKMEYSMEQHYRSIAKTAQPVYLCDACGVRFSTSDTLVAHQTYYCMKKPDSAMSKSINKKCENSNSPPVESPFSGPEEWKCNFCDATGSSYETIRRHLLTHGEPKGYRCLLCGYKGNTLRGMRTHACEHLSDDSTASIEEFMASTVVGETGPITFLPKKINDSDDDSNSQKDSVTYRNRIRTTSNNSETPTIVKRERLVSDASESDVSDSPRSSENFHKEPKLKVSESAHTESGESNLDANGNQDSVNPLSFCDVVIKSETVSGNDSDHSDVIKPETEHDRENVSPVDQQYQSVIRIADKHVTSSTNTKRKNKFQGKLNSDMKSCKSCGVSFQHMSSLLTHKKYYCVSRSLQNCIPETAAVQ